MFAFVLQNRGRATLVGETTRGAAHKTHLFSLKDSELTMAIPVGTVIDPKTGTDWEGKGVEPDVVVSAGKAWDIAYQEALEKSLTSDPARWQRVEIQWALQEVAARLNPVSLDTEDLLQYVGTFGERRIYIKKGVLSYQREGNAEYELVPMAQDLFSFRDPGMFYVRIKFERDKGGIVDKLIMLYDTGQKQVSKKN